MFGTEEGPGLSTMPEDFNPFDIFEQFFQDLGGSGGFHRGSSGGTRFSFNNGNGTFTVFSSGFGSPFFHEFGEDDDNDINPFEDIFFGRSRTINRERNSRRNRLKIIIGIDMKKIIEIIIEIKWEEEMKQILIILLSGYNYFR